MLWYYNNIYNSLTNLDKQIAILIRQQGPKPLTAVSMDLTGVRGGRVDNTEATMYRLQVLEHCRAESLLALDKADGMLQEISKERGCELYGMVLRLWYIEKLPKEEIADRVGYATRVSVYQIKQRAIRKFAANMFGVNAVKAM